jgi:hypothetical protein
MSKAEYYFGGAVLFCFGFLVGALLSGMIVQNYVSDHWLKKLEYHGFADWDEKRSQFVPVWEKKEETPKLVDVPLEE